MRAKETSKQRSVRIPLDYFKKSDGLGRWKSILAAIAAFAALAWAGGLGGTSLRPSELAERSRMLASRGPLAKAHATWENDCEVCHVAYRPVDGSNWAARLIGNPHEGDAKCRSCHEGAPHHATRRPDDVGSCASCHRDHRGREASLVSDVDADCTSCHAALEGRLVDGAKSQVAARVARFAPGAHPEFSKPSDPGRLKFNHALHMTKGLVGRSDGRTLKTIGELREEDRPRYREAGETDATPISLRCASCHRTNADGDRPGAYMKPVAYETDCKACHPLDFDPSEGPIRHGLQPEGVRDALRQVYAARFLRENPELALRPSPDRPVPGRAERPEAALAREAVGERVIRAERILFGGNKCGECHEFTSGSKAGEPSLVVPPAVPAVWMPRSFFDHACHRAMNCRDCHARAYPGESGSSKASDVLMPAMSTCVACHAPKNGDKGGAGHSCTECHRYHGRETPPIVAAPSRASAPTVAKGGSEPDPLAARLSHWAFGRLKSAD